MRVRTSFGSVNFPQLDDTTLLTLSDLTCRLHAAEKARARENARQAKLDQAKLIALGQAYRLLMGGIQMSHQPAGVTSEATLIKAMVIAGPSESRMFAETMHGARLLQIHPDRFMAALQAGESDLLLRWRHAAQESYRNDTSK